MPNKNSLKFRHNIVAIVYDFDGTLTPRSMQEYTIFPEIGYKTPQQAKKFWNEVKKENEKTQGEEILTYMRLMIEKCRERKFALTPKVIKDLATRIKYYPGVPTFFQRINKYAKKNLKGMKLRHYIISAGLKDIIEEVPIAKYAHKIYASEYYYNEYGTPEFPKVLINGTLKTQFLFRINKGREDINDNINDHMSHELRAIPFQNMLYIGDGLTDVPCMAVTREKGGYAIAVHQSYSKKQKNVCRQLLESKRVDFVAKADFRSNSELEKYVKLLLHNMHEGINYNRQAYSQWKTHLRRNKKAR